MLILTYYLGRSISLGQLLAIGLTPFIVLDLIKAAAAAALSRAVYRRLWASGLGEGRSGKKPA